MIEVKFRGKRVEDGNIVYGDLTHWKDRTFINDCAVYPLSVAQLAYIDDEGNEIYEGDNVTSHGRDFIVSIEPTANGDDVIFMGDPTYKFVLKK